MPKQDEGDTYRCGSCGETRWAGSVSWWTDCENCGASDWHRAATDGGVTEQDYDWQLRVTLNGVDFTGPGCATKQEAEALETVVRDADGVKSTEVERR